MKDVQLAVLTRDQQRADWRDRKEHGRSDASPTPMEKLIADIWADLLQLERVGTMTTSSTWEAILCW
jgi:hypothetical protein